MLRTFLTCTLFTAALATTPAHGSGFTDWLQQQFAPRPTVVGYAPAANCCPTPTACAPAACPPTACAPTYAAARPTRVRYVPQTTYRTTWAQVPVTVYRPVATVDPASGCSVTCMRPCTTYTWQARRVPYTTFRPVGPQGSCLLWPWSRPRAVPVAAPGACCPPTVDCGSCYSATPAYGMTTAPGCSSCVAPAATTIQGAVPPASTTPAGARPGPEPADIKPSLAPDAVQSNYPPQNAPQSPAPPATLGAPLQDLSPPANQPETTPDEADSQGVQPIPDPEVKRFDVQPRGVPALLDPRDRAAMRWDRPQTASPIFWATTLPPQAVIRPAVERRELPPPVADEPELETGGWRVVVP